MGWHSMYDNLDDIVSPGNLEIIDLTERHDVRRCPFCNKSPLGILYDNFEDKRVYRLLCTQHQDECVPGLCTMSSENLEDAVSNWNIRVETATSKQRKIKSNHSRDIQSFEDVSHKDFLNFLEGGGNDG